MRNEAKNRANGVLASLASAVERVNGRGPFWKLPPIRGKVWYDDQGNLLARSANRIRYVMVDFERPLMEKSAEILCRKGGNILNVGFGCGIIDNAIQKHDITCHTIIEGHPAVRRFMAKTGWGSKKNVNIIAERWENVDWWNYRHKFDGVYFDPFPFDPMADEQILWRECLIKILKPDTGVFVMYGPTLNLRKVKKEIAQFRKRVVVDSIHYCSVNVPFIVHEWEPLGLGRHRVPIFSLRIKSD